CLCFDYVSVPILNIHSFPTRRSSDLRKEACEREFHQAEQLRDNHIHSIASILPERKDSLLFNVLAKDYYNIKQIIAGLKEVSLRSEEHTSELQSRFDIVCRLLLEKKK